MFFAKLHPLLVHFPMALLFSGAFFQLFGSLQRETVIQEAGTFNIRLGFLTLPVIMAVGGFAILELQVNGLADYFLASHIRYAFGTLFIFAIYLSIQQFRGKIWAEAANYFLLLAGLITVFLTGFFGGELVHRFGIAVAEIVETL